MTDNNSISFAKGKTLHCKLKELKKNLCTETGVVVD